VGDAIGAIVVGTAVGIEIAVLVGCGGGIVGVLNGTVWVKDACTVNAAAVNTTFGLLGSGVAVPDGKLQAEIMSTKTLTKEMMRKVLNILFSSINSVFYTNKDGQVLPFVPKYRRTKAVSFQAVACFNIPNLFHAGKFLQRFAESKTGVEKTPVLLDQVETKKEALFLVGLSIRGGWDGASYHTSQDDHRHDIWSHQ